MEGQKLVAIFYLLNSLIWWFAALTEVSEGPTQIAIVHQADGPHSHSLEILVIILGLGPFAR